jgi:hypothetical protein
VKWRLWSTFSRQQSLPQAPVVQLDSMHLCKRCVIQALLFRAQSRANSIFFEVVVFILTLA